jgi:hypothetical protein
MRKGQMESLATINMNVFIWDEASYHMSLELEARALN